MTGIPIHTINCIIPRQRGNIHVFFEIEIVFKLFSNDVPIVFVSHFVGTLVLRARAYFEWRCMQSRDPRKSIITLDFF